MRTSVDHLNMWAYYKDIAQPKPIFKKKRTSFILLYFARLRGHRSCAKNYRKEEADSSVI